MLKTDHQRGVGGRHIFCPDDEHTCKGSEEYVSMHPHTAEAKFTKLVSLPSIGESRAPRRSYRVLKDPQLKRGEKLEVAYLKEVSLRKLSAYRNHHLTLKWPVSSPGLQSPGRPST